MGGAGAAVLWGEPDVWANPATLAGVRGVGWLSGHTRIAPDISDELEFDSDRLLMGAAGLGLSFMGQPISGVGRARLDSGPIYITTAFGVDEFRVIDETKGWAVGLSPLRLLDALRRSEGTDRGSLTERGEISIGYQGKRTLIRVEPGGGSINEGDSYDWGVSGRLALAPFWGSDPPFRLDLSGAWSESGILVPHTQDFGGGPMRFDRAGAALRLSPPSPSKRSASPPSMPWWRPGDAPAVTLGLAYDHEHRFDEARASDAHVHRFGVEANVLRLFALRLGYVSDSEGDVQGATYGGGVTLPIGPWGHVGYDVADVPRPSGFDRQLRQGWSAWLDPIRFFDPTR
jgi:hypothetical protein